jgi:hypothetical protein
MNAMNEPGVSAKNPEPKTERQPAMKNAMAAKDAPTTRTTFTGKPKNDTSQTPTDKTAKTAAVKKPVGKQVDLRLVYISFWSALKLSLLAAAAVAIATIVLLFVLQTVLETVGLIDTLDEMVGLLTDGSMLLSTFLNMEQVMKFAIVVAIINFVAVTVMGAVVAGVYNMAVKITGGLRVGFMSN